MEDRGKRRREEGQGAGEVRLSFKVGGPEAAGRLGREGRGRDGGIE